jgi:hypothetical protein
MNKMRCNALPDTWIRSETDPMTYCIPSGIPLAAIVVAALMAPTAPAAAQPLIAADVPFTATLSNTTPLAFGMGVAAAARALDTPLTYLRGRPGDEIYLAYRNIGGSGFFARKDRLFLQFRHGRLTGWKGDWGTNWMWE